MSTSQIEPWADPFAGLPLLISVPRAAKLIGISRAAADRFANAGQLAHQTTWPPRLCRYSPLADGFCGIEKRFVDIFSGQLRMLGEDLVGRHPIRDHRQHCRDREAQPSAAWHPQP